MKLKEEGLQDLIMMQCSDVTKKEIIQDLMKNKKADTFLPD